MVPGPIKEIQILSPDGQSRFVPLAGDRISVGRSASAEISFPDDSGLSRQHLTIERDDEGWALRDLGSKNGTTLNGSRVTGRTSLKSGDRIAAGHLILVYDGAGSPGRKPVVVFDPVEETEAPPNSDTVVTRLEGVIGSRGPSGEAETLAATHVSALIRAGNELAGHRPLQELFPFILELSIQAVKADRGVLMTFEENSELVPRANKGEGFRISAAVRDRVLNTGVSVLVRDTSLDDAFRERRSIVDQQIRTLMAVPLQTSERIIGIIYVDSPSLLRKFTKDDLNLLTVMANVAAIRIEHTRLLEVEREEQRLALDLALAAEIQRSFLPSVAPKIRGIDLAGHNAPCRTVGGDYYDFFAYGDDRVAMVLGDVSGKGMPASLLMMGLQARVQVLIDEPKSLADVMTRLNRITSANCPPNRFISLFLCILDGTTGELVFCKAGHNPPLIVRASGDYEQLDCDGPVLGILPFVEYPEYRTKLEQGDTIVIYSDGVTEAANPAGEEFGIEGLAEVVVRNRDCPASAIANEINRTLATFTAFAPPADDITLVVARRIE